ncbi:MAG TPA: hypothetical protein VE035_06160 [Puia sp.]|nr:hypothetical protein [Puia sp.]
MEKTNEQLVKYREMLWQMEMDMLIDMGKDYTIEFREGILLIDGRVQPSRVQDKYRNYFEEETGKIFKKTETPKKEFRVTEFLKLV